MDDNRSNATMVQDCQDFNTENSWVSSPAHTKFLLHWKKVGKYISRSTHKDSTETREKKLRVYRITQRVGDMYTSFEPASHMRGTRITLLLLCAVSASYIPTTPKKWGRQKKGVATLTRLRTKTEYLCEPVYARTRQRLLKKQAFFFPVPRAPT